MLRPALAAAMCGPLPPRLTCGFWKINVSQNSQVFGKESHTSDVLQRTVTRVFPPMVQVNNVRSQSSPFSSSTSVFSRISISSTE